MLTQLQLEGPELEPLLVRVRSELGAAARIVQAEKVRSGGVAGFFARERYELTVEVDDEPSHAAATAPAPRRAGDLTGTPTPAGSTLPAPSPQHHVRVEQPGEVERIAAQHVHPGPVASEQVRSGLVAPEHARTDPMASEHVRSELVASEHARITPEHARTGLPGRAAPAPAAPPAPSFAAVTGLGGPVDRPTDAYSPMAGLSTGAPRGAHDAVVATLAAVTGSTPADLATVQSSPARADVATPPAFPQDGFAAHPSFPALADHVPPARPVPPTPAAAAPLSLLDLADQVSDEEQAAVVSTESPSFASLLSQLGSRLGAEAPVTVPTATLEQASPRTVPPLDHAPSAPLAAITAAPTASAPAVPQQRTPAAADAAPASPTGGGAAAASSQREDRGPDTTGAELARLGLPPHLRPQSSGEQLHTALRAALTRLPSAPPATNRAGGVLAVVGPLALALRVAREIAEELGLPVSTSVAVATAGEAVPEVAARQLLHQPAEAADRRATWRRRGNLTVVAVDAPLTSTGAADAREFLAALAPSATWGVVEATRKAQDIGAWTRALGGVHALALTDVEETADPAAVLELGIPVSRLGARPATPRAWATLLTGRLAA